MTSWTNRDASNATVNTTAWEYDAVGNVRRVKASYRAINADGALATASSDQDYWYLYDSMNRFTLTKGSLSYTNGSGDVITGDAARGSGTINRGTEGTAITYYLDGNRRSAEYSTTLAAPFWVYAGPSGQLMPIGDEGGSWQMRASYAPGDRREDYTYTADGYLAETTKADGWWDAGPQPDPSDLDPPERIYHAPSTTNGAVGKVTRDALGRITAYFEQGGFDGSFERANVAYDMAGRELSETAITIRRDTTGGPSQTYTTYITNSYTGGLLTQQFQWAWKNGVDSGSSGAPDSKQTYDYVWWDGALQSIIRNDNDNNGTFDWTTTHYYDSSGHITQANIVDGQPRNANFITDQNGQIIDRIEVKLANNTTTAGNPHAVHYNFGGLQMGVVGNNGTDNVSYSASIANRLRPKGTTGPFASGSASATPMADFEQSYDAINGTSTASTSSSYTVNSGDTLTSIAQAVWGDSSLWYMIAEANGLTGSEALAAGRVLTIPNKVHNSRNAADTWRPYDPNEALGDTSPTTAKPPKKPLCGVFGMILLAVVAIAVAAWAGPGSIGFFQGLFAAGGAIVPGSLAAIAGGIVGGAVAGAAGSIASQVFGLATGLQQGGFNWKGVALAAIGGAVGGGISEFAKGAMEGAKAAVEAGKAVSTIDKFGTFLGGSGFISGAARAITSNVLTQGVAIATHLQKRFDFVGVAAAGVGGAISGELGRIDIQDSQSVRCLIHEVPC